MMKMEQLVERPSVDDIKFYLDEKCKVPLQKVKWDKGFLVTMADGKEELLKNTVVEGTVATATFFVRNESQYKFGVRQLRFPNEKVKIWIEEVWLFPAKEVKVVLSVNTSHLKNIEIVESAQFSIEGFFVINR